MKKRSVLIVNEDAGCSFRFSSLLSSLGYTDHLQMSPQRALSWITQGNVPLFILLNITQSGASDLKFLPSIRNTSTEVPIIAAASTSQIRLVVEALQMGADDYLLSSFDCEQAQLAIQNALEKERSNEPKCTTPDDFIEGPNTSPEMRRASEIAKMVARTDVPVLITGESGVGKEVFARFIHNRSPRAQKALVKVNCAALPNDLLESELFGYERGAFTGATIDKPGKFELAMGGTILLDEIGEMTPHLQAKLLHVLQDGEFSRLGGTRQYRADARVLASTNRKLEEAVASGHFRDDLYFRLNVIRIKIPPLRERKQEIELLANYFVRKYRDKYGSHVQALPPEFLRTLMQYDWPGNVRQLENVIKRYLIMPELSLDADHFYSPVQPKAASIPETAPAVSPPPPKPSPAAEFSSLKEVGEVAAERAQREVVLRMLEETNWNRKLAARRLNICYKALLNKIKKWQIRRPAINAAGVSRRRIVAKISLSESEQFAVHAVTTGNDAS
jgi:two-component system response regulator AtoC